MAPLDKKRTGDIQQKESLKGMPADIVRHFSFVYFLRMIWLS